MDIEEISGPKVPAVIHPPITRDGPEPVEEKVRLLHIHPRTSPYEDLQRWIVEDKVTISPEARRKHRQLLFRRNKSKAN